MTKTYDLASLTRRRKKIDAIAMLYRSFEKMPESVLDALATASHDETTARIVLEFAARAPP
jgi:hypothetical protein